jgi:protein-tyrosine-phosphatase
MTLFEALQQRRGRVLFVCLGNSCRSQTAEAFAKAYGNDVIEAASATGDLPSFDLSAFDLIVNLSEYGVPATDTMVLKLPLPDLVMQAEDAHREVRDKIEAFVRFLVDHFRVAREWSTVNPLYSERCAVAMSSR